MLTKLILLIATALACAAQSTLTITPQNYFRTSQIGDAQELGDAAETITLRAGGTVLAPSISLRNNGQAFFLAALKFGAIMSLYRREPWNTGEMREWLRLSYSGIEVEHEGQMKQAFSGKIRAGCAAVVAHGLIVGEDCGALGLVIEPTDRGEFADCTKVLSCTGFVSPPRAFFSDPWWLKSGITTYPKPSTQKGTK